MYKIGTDGVAVFTDSALWQGWEPVGSLKELQTYSKKELGVQLGNKWAGPKIPKELFGQVLATFKHYAHREVAVMLYFDIPKNSWYVKVPPQSATGASVKYDDKEKTPDGCILIGTIHTHPQMSAFWSGTDYNDQKDKHGLHIVFGTTDSGYPRSWKVTRFFPGGQRDLELLDIIEELPAEADLPEPPKEWLEILDKPLPPPALKTTPITTTGGSTTRPTYSYTGSLYTSNTYKGRGYWNRDYEDLDYGYGSRSRWNSYSRYREGDTDEAEMLAAKLLGAILESGLDTTEAVGSMLAKYGYYRSTPELTAKRASQYTDFGKLRDDELDDALSDIIAEYTVRDQYDRLFDTLADNGILEDAYPDGYDDTAENPAPEKLSGEVING